MKLKNKVAVITGGNSGIGFAIAQEYKREGAKVAILGRNPTKLKQAQQSLGENSIAVQGDVTQLTDLEKLYQTTTQTFKQKIDVLVANAGIANVVPLEQVTESNFDQMIAVNLKGVYFTVQRALPFLNDYASIILISSIAGTRGRGKKGVSLYAGTKAAVKALAYYFSAELLARHIRVNSISPGYIQTELFDKAGLDKATLTKMLNAIPVKRFGKPEEIAKAALFLASDDSAYMIGADMVVDGGVTEIIAE